MILSAYQRDYQHREGSKFSITLTGDSVSLLGPIHLLNEAEIYVHDSETILLFAKYLKFGSTNQREFQDILHSLNSITYPLAMNALKIIKMDFEIDIDSTDILVNPKTITISTDELPNITL